MAYQRELFDGDDDPVFVPFHSVFTGTCEVASSKFKSSSDVYRVDLDNGTCSCKIGDPFRWDTKKPGWVKNRYCNHKLLAMSDLVKRNSSDPQVTWAYVKALATRYNRFESVSAFHKELRRADIELAWYWGNIIIAQRGNLGAIKYMYNIIYEETRDHVLAAWLNKKLAQPASIEVSTVYKAISWFCQTPKKWELDWRLDIFKTEMRGYRNLIKRYGKDVAKGGDIIPFDQYSLLLKELEKSLIKKNADGLQTAVKGLQKLKTTKEISINDIRSMTIEKINIHLSKSSKKHRKLYDMLQTTDLGGSLSYHHTNMFADLCLGELARGATLTTKQRQAILNRPTVPLIRLGKPLSVPLYAHDNHTYLGKAIIKKYPNQLKPGAKQIDMDLRYCGAYFGVAWRMLCYHQYGNIDVRWQDVVWNKWMYNVVSDLWY